GADFFVIEVLTWRGLVTYHVLFFLELETRRVTLAGFTRHPTEAWITRYLLNGRSPKLKRRARAPPQPYGSAEADQREHRGDSGQQQALCEDKESRNPRQMAKRRVASKQQQQQV